ncbi:hypothetical protein BD408DRAFT_409673 [Parasitella parasitica]|nr:hypothetical protein BD408DRAFT_409673 [Parasitella parasitica]
MKLKYLLVVSGFITNSVVLATQIEKIKEQVWNENDSAWEEVNNPDVVTNDSTGGPVYETVTVTTTWVAPDLNIWAYADGYLPATTTVYDTEDEAQMALEREGGKKKKFRRKKKHFKKKKHHRSRPYIKPQAYLDEQQAASSKDAFTGKYQDILSMQEGDIIVEEWEDQYGNVIAASVYSYNHAGNAGTDEKDIMSTSISEPPMPASISASLGTAETLFPKVLLNDKQDVVSSNANTVKGKLISWAMAPIAIVCYLA